MTVDKHLLKDERILASAEACLVGTLFATNKRVIIYEKSFFGEKVDSRYYRHIVGASYESHPHIGLLAVGVVFLILGWLVTGTPFFGYYRSFPGGILILLGFVAIAVGIFHRSSWYQLNAVGLSDELDKLHWRTSGVDSEANNFVRVIEEQISTCELPPPSTKEKRMRAVVMAKCEYCGALMPQTATFCPNCGRAI